MALSLSVDGKKFDNFENATFTRSVVKLASKFAFSAVSKQGSIDSFPVKEGQDCIVYADDKKVLTGYIEKISVSYGTDKHVIKIEGRSKTCDIVDTMVFNLNFGKKVGTLEQVAKKALELSGIKVNVIFQAPEVKINASQIKNAKSGEKLFKFLDRICRQHQVLMTDNEHGDLVFVKNEGALVEGFKVQNVKGLPGNNIKSAEFSWDTTERYRTYVCYSQTSLVDIADDPAAVLANINSSKTISKLEATGKSDFFVDRSIRNGRTKYFKMEQPTSVEGELKARAEWEAINDAGKGLMYQVVLFGHTPLSQESPWQANLLVDVEDEFCGIGEKMLIMSLTLDYSRGRGSTTRLSLTRKDGLSAHLQTLKQLNVGKSKGLGGGIVDSALEAFKTLLPSYKRAEKE